MSRRPTLLTLLLLPVLFHACTPPEPPISAAEALTFAKKVERSITQQNPTLLDNIFDAGWFGRQVTAASGNTLKASTVSEAVKDIRKAHFGQRILSIVGKDGTYLLLRQYEKDHRQHLLFRLYGDAGINYHDFELVKVDDQIKAIDVYIYQTGENFSKTIADLLILVDADRPNTTKEDKEKSRLTNRLRKLIGKKEFEAARDCYDSLPVSYKHQKAYQLYHIQIGSQLGDSLHSKSLLEYQALFPNDPSLYLLMINAYILQKQYPLALTAIDKLDSTLGKDPFQDYYRGLVYSRMKDSARALTCLDRKSVV